MGDDDKLRDLAETFRRRRERHKVSARSKKSEVVENYHLGYADAYEIAADHVEALIDDET